MITKPYADSRRAGTNTWRTLLNSRLRGIIVISLAVIGLFAIATVPASATTFCVPGYFAECPNNGTNVAEPVLETAMQTNAFDGIADRIYIDDFTVVDPGTVEPAGTDDLDIIGSGTGKSEITSSDTGNQFVMNLANASRLTNMQDLTIVIPSSFPDGLGSALQAKDGTFDRVDVETRNPGSNGANSLLGDTIWRNSHLYGTNGAKFDFAIEPGNSASGKLEIINTTIDDASWGILADQAGVPVVLKNSRINPVTAYAVRISNGSPFSMENSVIVTGGNEGISVETGNQPGEGDIDVSVRTSTIVQGANADATDRGIKVEIGGQPGSRSVDVAVTDSIIRGFDHTWEIDAPAGPGVGYATLSFKRSNLHATGLPEDSPAVDFDDPTNIDQDPKFAGATDFHLLKGSPSIDAGNPETGGILEDIEGNPRPQDGNGDGSAIRDQGAYEAPKDPTCANTAELCPVTPPPPGDETAPVISKIKFKAAKQKKAGSLAFTLSEAATVKAIFKPTPAGKGKKKRTTMKFSKTAKAGVTKLKIKRGKLKPGRYRLSIVATDVAGNESETIVRKVKVKTAK